MAARAAVRAAGRAVGAAGADQRAAERVPGPAQSDHRPGGEREGPALRVEHRRLGRRLGEHRTEHLCRGHEAARRGRRRRSNAAGRSQSVRVNISQGIERLCYRYPSPLVDAVTEHEPGRRIVAVKNVTVNEDFFQGHFPGRSADAGRPDDRDAGAGGDPAADARVRPADGARAFLRGVDNAKFRLKVVPGDRLRLEVTLGSRRTNLARAHGAAYHRRPDRRRGGAGAGPGRRSPAAARVGVSIDPTAIVHPDAHDRRAAPAIGPHAIDRRARPHRPRLPHRRLGGDRRLDRDRRRQRDLPDGLGRADPAGPEVRRRADAPGDRQPQRDPRVRRRFTAARPAAAG